MSYNPATAAEILASLSERFLTAEGQAVGEDVVLRLAREGVLKVVDNLNLKYADDAYAKGRLAHDGITDVAEWVVLAFVDRDETYFCNFNQTWEYCYTDYAVVAPAARVAEERALAAKAGFPEYP